MDRKQDTSRDEMARPSMPIDWHSVLITAHVETARGPCLHMLRASVEDGSTYEVEARGELEDNHSACMVFISDLEMVFSLRSPIEHEADATLAVEFEVEQRTRIELTMVGSEQGPPMVVRGLGRETVFVLDDAPGEIILEPGRWSMQATAVPDDRERLGIIRFSSVKAAESESAERAV